MNRTLRVTILFFISALVCIVFVPATVTQASTGQTPTDHTMATVDNTCTHVYVSSDGNPFPICPGPLPKGGNCTWWAWEQWHLLGYNLPLNWGNAADWVVDAERAGLPMGTLPRAGSIAVFPVGDGFWAYSAAGHVAFVTWVSADQQSFNVTYQNYGIATPFYTGTGYRVSTINQAQYQNGKLRFIYFPRKIDVKLFAKLPGVDGNGLAAVLQANGILDTSNNPFALGLSQVSTDQEFNADFTGSGLSDLLLYDRQAGRLDLLSLAPTKHTHSAPSDPQNDSSNANPPKMVQLPYSADTPDGWGSSLDIHIGNFSGSSTSELLLYDRDTGQITLISLNPDLTIKNRVELPGWGSGWELYVGRFDGTRSGIFMYNRYAEYSSAQSGNALGGTASSDWDKQGRTSVVYLVDFNTDFSILHMQQYTLWHNAWEVYVGRFVSATQDGIFLYDRTSGEARLMDFDTNLLLADYEAQHGLAGNWQVYSGDFNGSGHAQLLLYDPTTGDATFQLFAHDLSLVDQKQYTNWGQDMVLYTGHFGMSALSVMLDDPHTAKMIFLAFDSSLNISRRYDVKGQNAHLQILVGSFLDRSRCLASGDCSKGDDILALDRQTGTIQRYIFSFGVEYQVYDNRAQAFLRNGMTSQDPLQTVDTTSFSLSSSLATNISNEELY